MRSDRVFVHDHTDGLQAVFDSEYLDETTRSRKSAGYSRPALPRSPQRPPLLHCASSSLDIRREFSSAYLQKTSENIHLELRECDISATV